MKKTLKSVFPRFFLSALLIFQLVGLGALAPAMPTLADFVPGRGLNQIFSFGGKTSFPFNTVLDFTSNPAQLGNHTQTGDWVVITGVNSPTVKLQGSFGYHDTGYVVGGPNTDATIDQETVLVKTWSPKDGPAPDFTNPNAVAALKNAVRVGGSTSKYDDYGMIDNCDATLQNYPIIVPGADNSSNPAAQNICYNTNYLNNYTFSIPNYASGSVLVLYAGAAQLVNPDTRAIVPAPSADYPATSIDVFAIQAVPVVTGAPQLTLTKTAKNPDGTTITGPLAPGSDVIYQLDFKNPGTVATSGNLTLTDTFNTSYVSSVVDAGGGTVSAGKVTWKMGRLGAGASGVRSFHVKLLSAVNDKIAGVYDVPNSATVTDGTLTANANKTVQVAYTDNLYVKKSASIFANDGTSKSLVNVRPGDIVTYTMEFGNTGSAKTTNTHLRDVIANADKFNILYTTPGAVVSTETATPNSTRVAWNPVADAGNCRPTGKGCGDPVPTPPCPANLLQYGCVASSGIRQIIVKLNSVFPHGNTALNDTVTLVSDQATRQAVTTVVVPAAADCVLTKAVDKSVANPGDQITYTFTYQNKSTNAICTSASIEDVLSGLNQQFLTIVPGSVSNGGTVTTTNSIPKVTWNIGNVNPGATGTVSFKATIANSFPGQSGNSTIYINDDGTIYFAEAPAGVPSNQVSTLVGTGPVLNIVKAVDKSLANPGDTIVYTVTVKNTGNAAATNVVVADPFSGQNQNYLTYVSSSVTKGANDTYALGGLAINETKTVTITAKISATIPVLTGGTTILDTARVSADTTPTLQSNQVATAVNAVALLSVTKSVSAKTLKPNDTFTYTLTYTNSGNARANNVVVKDPFTNTNQQYITFVSSSPAPDPGSTSQWTIGPVDAGKTGTITITARVKNSVPTGQTTVHDVALASSNETGSRTSNEVTFVVVYAPPSTNPPTTPKKPVPTTGQSLSVVLATAGIIGLIGAALYVHRRRKFIRLKNAGIRPEGTIPPVTMK